jgi:hypothetical protein
MAGTWGTCSGEERCIQNYGGETDSKDKVEVVDVHEKIRLKGSYRSGMGGGGGNYINLMCG